MKVQKGRSENGTTPHFSPWWCLLGVGTRAGTTTVVRVQRGKSGNTRGGPGALTPMQFWSVPCHSRSGPLHRGRLCPGLTMATRHRRHKNKEREPWHRLCWLDCFCLQVATCKHACYSWKGLQGAKVFGLFSLPHSIRSTSV